MAGGIGSRFWPVSLQDNPKQFHDMLGVGKSLIQMTFDRFTDEVSPERIYVVTHASYRERVAHHLPMLPVENILIEPIRRNTAPCLAYAAFIIQQKNPDAVMVVAAADHLILKENVFLNAIKLSVQQAQAKECLITIGIKPNRPDTGYGYIQFNPEPMDGSVHECVKKVKTFTEKPDHALARQFLESGEFYWNSGMFVWKNSALLTAFKEFMPEVYALFTDWAEGGYDTNQFKSVYSQCPNISIDYGIMEKSDNVCMVLANDFGWSDLGTWGSLYVHGNKDEQSNVANGGTIMFYNATGNMIRSQKNKITVIEGLEDFIVVDTERVLLIVKRENEQRIKEFVNDLKSARKEEFL
jgi:mannose-1-phosphate guanylyltransferase